jgi:hypothetical protein
MIWRSTHDLAIDMYSSRYFHGFLVVPVYTYNLASIWGINHYTAVDMYSSRSLPGVLVVPVSNAPATI